jgi:hypothetical protein
MKRTLKNILILFSTLSYLQNNSDFDVFKKIIEHESGTGVLGLYVHRKSKTTFDQKVVLEETELEVPKNILRDIEINVAKVVIWNLN